MTVVNFATDSDFKWILLTIAGSWAGSLGPFRLEERGNPRPASWVDEATDMGHGRLPGDRGTFGFATGAVLPCTEPGAMADPGRCFGKRGRAMKSQHLPLYAIALAILVVGLAFASVSVPTILFSLLALACPLMMMFMMGGGHGGDGGGPDEHADGAGDHRHGPTAGQR